MAKKANSKFSLVALIAFAVIVVSLILVIVGYAINWVSSTGEVLGASKTTYTKLSELAKGYKDLGDLAADTMKGFSAMNAFAIITLIATIASTACYVVSNVLNIKLFKLITAVVGVVTVICAIVLIITTFSFTGNYTNNVGKLASLKCSPAAGPWLMTIFGVIGGAATAVGAMKK